MAQLFHLSGRAYEDSTGAPYALAKAYFYVTGTTTPQDTYTSASLAVANANPVVAGADGIFGDIYFAAKRYKVVVKDASDNTLDTWDPIDATSQLIASAAAPSPTYPFLRYHNTTDGKVYRRNAADNAWIDEGGVDSLLNAASVTEQLTGTATDKASTPDSVAALWQRGTDIASASSLSLPSSGGGVFNITGTTTVNGISSAQGGHEVWLKFAAGCQLTHDGTSFILLDGVNETTAAGYIYAFRNEAAADASSSNWRCFARSRPTGQPAAKTGNYTVVDADRGGFLRFSGLSADATVTLPAAANRSGFEITIVNADVFADNVDNASPKGVIVDANGAELIDGFSTRKTYAFSRVTLVCDGTGWRTKAGQWRYFSGNQTITAAGALVLAHGLGVRPQKMWIMLQNVTAEGNYTQYDIVPTSFVFTDATVYGASVVPDATNLNVRYASTAAVFHVQNKTTGAVFAITPANWRAQFYAED